MEYLRGAICGAYGKRAQPIIPCRSQEATPRLMGWLVKAGLLFSSSNQYLQDARAYTCHEIIAEQAESAGEERGEQVARGQAEGRFPGQ